jgi:uncharacterized membrane protein YbhN (UPF0104 family)
MKWQRLAPIVLTIAILLGIVYWFRDAISLERLTQRIADAHPGYLALSLVFFTASTIGSVARYKLVIERATQSRVSFTYLYLLSGFSFAAGYLAPMGAASDVLRIAFTKRYLDIGYVKSTRLIILDRLVALAGVAAIAVAFSPLKMWYGLNRQLLIAELLGLAALFVLVPTLAYGGTWIAARISWLAGFEAALKEDLDIIRTSFLDLRTLIAALVWMLIAVSGFGLGTLCCAAAMGFEGDLVAFVVAAPTIMLAQSLPMLYAGFGAREVALLIAFQGVAGADPTVLLGVSLVTGIMIFVTTLPAALAFMVRVGR